MLNDAIFSELINDWIKNLDIPSRPSGLYEPIKYTMSSGGKRLRPLLMMAVMSALGKDPVDCKNQALAIEMFHNFTLLHDDVMDNSEIRRGRMTVHKRWSPNVAILSGDAMLTIASALAARCPHDKVERVLHLFNKTAIEVYEGQQYDMDFEHSRSVTVEQYIEMIRLKTSVLLGCACKMGAILADADEATAEAFYKFGECLGLGFQLKDDWLDTYGDPLIFGKQIGGDIINNKKTWLLITALNEDRNGVVAKALTAPLNKTEKIMKVIAVYDSLNLNARCLQLVDKYASEALGYLDSITLSVEARRYFTALTHRLTNRNY
jgi:geranylgeranyl diphosphate synthase type II